MADGDDTGALDGTSFDPVDTTSSDSFTETTHESWLERLMGAIVGVLIGLVLVLACAVGLFWNEGRAVQTSRSLAEGSGMVVDADAARVDPANEGRLVHVQGDLATGAALSDTDLGVEARAARLVRDVEMFQWREESHTTTHKNLGGSEDKVTTYTYAPVWSDSRIDSSRFRNPSGHANPQPRYAKFETAARDASPGLPPSNSSAPTGTCASSRPRPNGCGAGRG